MAALSQLRLLLWKNYLTQKRSIVFTLFEFFVPLILIGASFGLMIGFRDQFETNNTAIVYPSWNVKGASIDFFLPVSITKLDLNGGILPLYTFLDEDDFGTHFLKITRSPTSDLEYNIEMTIAYAPNTSVTDAIMKSVEIAYGSKYENTTLVQQICTGDLIGLCVLPIFKNNTRTLGNYTITMSTSTIGFETENAMVDYLTIALGEHANNPIIGGIVFDEKFASNADAKLIDYKIRLTNSFRNKPKEFGSGPGTDQTKSWNTKQMFEIEVVTGPRNKDSADGGAPGYWREGFLTLQRAVDNGIIDYLLGMRNSTARPAVQMQRYPYPAYETKIIEIGAIFIPFIIIYAFMASVIYITRNIVMEKENRLKEYMKVMGLSQWVHWIGYLIANYIKLFFNVVILTALMVPLMQQSDFSVILVFYMLYVFDVIYFSFAVSTFMHSGTAGTMMAVFAWMITYFWYALISNLNGQSPLALPAKLFHSLNLNIAMGFGMQVMAQYEVQATGIHWNNLFTPPTPDQDLTLGHCMLMLIVDGVLLAMLTWYIEAVNPGGEGVPQPPYFFLLPSYWFPGCNKMEARSSADMKRMVSNGATNDTYARIEPEPEGIEPTISVVGIGKVYGTSLFKKVFDCNFGKKSEKQAVDGLNLTMYPGQVTVLLGHNGAGKSTTFSMLNGVTAPSSGTAFIAGYDIRTSLPAIRKYLGLCPQYNILFNNLTVMEHLEFFCKLKARPYSKADSESILVRLKIDSKKDARAGTLSGGQKRKLSMAIALIGGSEIVMLDEPTSGMDPGARHEAWTLLQAEKAHRTILLTTHYMEEADLLGDRIAILAHGKLQCSGSSMYLKNQYGAGYNVTVVFQRESSNANLLLVAHPTEQHASKSRAVAVMQLLQKHCPDAEMQSAVGLEATFLLPSNYRNRFSELFRDLENNQQKLDISSFGVSITSMEEVFLKVGELADLRQNNSSVALDANGTNDSHADLSKSHSAITNLSNIEKGNPFIGQIRVNQRVRGMNRWLQQVHAMFVKRIIYFFRRWTQFIPQLIIPVLYMALLCWASQAIPTTSEQTPLRIDMAPYSVDNLPAYGIINSNDTSISDRYRSVLMQQSPGVNVNTTDSTSSVGDTVFSLSQVIGKHTFGIQYPIAADIKSLTWTAMFNNFGIHTLPLSLSAIDSTLMRSLLNQSDIAIRVTNHPLPPNIADKLKQQENNGGGAASVLSFAIIVAMSMVVSGYASFLIRERKKKSKHMQMMSGLDPWTYWLTAFVWDAVTFLLPTGLFLAIFAIFDIKEYMTDATHGTLTLLLIMLVYGWTTIPFVYAFSFAFSSAPKGYTLIVLYNIITGMIGAIAVPIISATSNADVAYTWSIILSFAFPTYNLSNCFTIIYSNEYIRQACADICRSSQAANAPMCCDPNLKGYSDNVLTDSTKKGIMYGFAFFIIQGFLYWILTMLLEYDMVRNVKRFFQPDRPFVGIANEGYDANYDEIEDSDVLAEKANVHQLAPNDASLIVQNLNKWYGRFHAVKGVNFHVKQNECFGLLGVNGAGKTSTFQMLTGENPVGDGDALVHGASCRNSWRKAGQHIGYCPQFDAVIKEMSGEETLYMFARIRGVPERDIPNIVAAVLWMSGENMQIFSGGNKRRLSLGIALVGLPDVLLLDEPTTGVDPKARRTIWNILSNVRAQGIALVLTSHSMEECEALCTELAIMVAGKFRCLGSAQHIKSRYGAGFTLLIRLRNVDDAPRVKSAIEMKFAGALLKEEHVLQLNYELPRDRHVGWSVLFDELESLVEPLNIADYSLSQTTLEQVFLEFSRAVNVRRPSIMPQHNSDGMMVERNPMMGVAKESYNGQPNAPMGTDF